MQTSSRFVFTHRKGERMPELISPLELLQDERVEEPEPEISATTDMEVVRELVLRAHPDVVPELIAGNSVEAILASVESARAAYERLAETWGKTNPGRVAVPAGGGTMLAVDPDKLPATEKIRRGLKVATAHRATRREE